MTTEAARSRLARTSRSPEYSRNFGFWNEAEQDALIGARVAIAGVGGDGFQLGLKLARMGVQSFAVADPESFEAENSNRVPGALVTTYGRNKAEVFREHLLGIDPAAKVDVFEEGVTAANVADFMHGANLVLDESELRHLEVGTVVARQARRLGIPNLLVMNVGFAAQVTSFHPHRGITFEAMMGFSKSTPLDSVRDMAVDLSRCLPYLPKYGDLRTLKAIETSKTASARDGAPLPSIAPGVDVASALGATQAFLHLTSAIANRRPKPIWAPRFAFIDPYSMTAGTTRLPRVSHYRHLIRAAVQTRLGKNPAASYTLADRLRREDPSSSA